MNLPVNQKHFLSFSRKLFLSVISLFLVFAICFIAYQSLVLDITKKKVSIDGEEVQLTKKEFEILLLLVQNKGRVFSREDILTRIWSDEVYVLDRTIDVNITRLRKKIGVYGKCIVTRLGYGYCFEAE